MSQALLELVLQDLRQPSYFLQASPKLPQVDFLEPLGVSRHPQELVFVEAPLRTDIPAKLLT